MQFKYNIMKLKILLLSLLLIIFYSCTKEYSCERCYFKEEMPIIETLDCNNTVLTSAIVNEPYTSTCSIGYTGGNGIQYHSDTVILSTGVLGLSAVLEPGFLINGNGHIVYSISGTPATAGTAVFNIQFGSQACSFFLNIDSVNNLPVNTHSIPMAAQDQRCLVVLSNGTVKSWGINLYGQIGDGTTITRTTPVLVNGLANITAVATGAFHSLALENNGTVWAWGNNDYGQLGDGTTNENHIAKKIIVLTKVVSIAASYSHSLALKNDGSVWAWGSNANGTLGDGTNTDKLFPIKVANLSGVKEIVCGRAQSFALKEDGTVWSWGLNALGALGIGTNTDSNVPVKITALDHIIQIAANGGEHCLALKADGSVWSWGYNSYGQLGSGNLNYSNSPAQLYSISDVVEIGIGDQNSFAVKSDGTAWAWGFNGVGEIGIENTNNDYPMVPFYIPVFTDVKRICAGQVHTIFQKSDNTTWTLGSNVFGQLGDGSNVISRFTPVQVPGL